MEIIPMNPCGVLLSGFVADDPDHLESFAAKFRQYSLVKLNDPNMTPDQHVCLMAQIGHVAADRPNGPTVSYLFHDPEKYAGFDPTNSKPEKFDDGELLFHFDFAFNDDWPCQAISLFGIEIPPVGGDTLFVHGAQAYDRLDEAAKQAIAGRYAIHIFDPYRTKGSIRTREAMLGRFPERGMHEVAWPHPYEERKVLGTALSSTDRIAGLPTEESEALLNHLFSVLYDQKHMYRQKWAVGDFIAWDNRVIQHSREHFDYRVRRRLRRVIDGDEAAIQRRVTRWKIQQPVEPIQTAERAQPA
jgi:alpha-ketoglutarate-dependent taurine dioxygenase